MGHGRDYEINSINEFINGDKAITVFDMYKMAHNLRTTFGVNDIIMKMQYEQSQEGNLVQAKYEGRGRKLGVHTSKAYLTKASSFYDKLIKQCSKP